MPAIATKPHFGEQRRRGEAPSTWRAQRAATAAAAARYGAHEEPTPTPEKIRTPKGGMAAPRFLEVQGTRIPLSVREVSVLRRALELTAEQAQTIADNMRDRSSEIAAGQVEKIARGLKHFLIVGETHDGEQLKAWRLANGARFK